METFQTSIYNRGHGGLKTAKKTLVVFLYVWKPGPQSWSDESGTEVAIPHSLL